MKIKKADAQTYRQRYAARGARMAPKRRHSDRETHLRRLTDPSLYFLLGPGIIDGGSPNHRARTVDIRECVPKIGTRHVTA